MRHYLLFLFLVFLAACQEDSSNLPNTPSEVAQQWQHHVDNNEFEAARFLSTPKAKEMVDMIERIVKEEDDPSSTITNTVFLSFDCSEQGDSASCNYSIREEGEIFKDSFFLKKINGQWLVDIPEEDMFFDEETLENMLKQLEQE